MRRPGQSPCGRYGNCPQDGCFSDHCWVDGLREQEVESEPQGVDIDDRAEVRVVAHTINVDPLNEWVVEVDGVRRARHIGPKATYLAARDANHWRRVIRSAPACLLVLMSMAMPTMSMAQSSLGPAAFAVRLRPQGGLNLPAHASHITVMLDGRRLRRVPDPAPDTCRYQWAYVLNGVTKAEYSACWRRMENWTRRWLVVEWEA